MKQVINTSGKVLVVSIVVALVLTFILAGLLPATRTFVRNVFVAETNYVEKSDLESAPTLSCSTEKVSVALGQEVDIFENIAARSVSGEDLLPQLVNDYSNPTSDRRQVFVYRVNADNSKTLVEEINSSRSGKWVVFYLVKDGKGSAMIKVPFVVED